MPQGLKIFGWVYWQIDLPIENVNDTAAHASGKIDR
jgi:hypothetical protein